MKRIGKWLAGMLLRLLGAALLLMGLAAMVHSRQYAGAGLWPMFFVAFLGVAAMSAGVGVSRIGKRLGQRSADEVLARAEQPPVLYLRAFRRDTTETLLPRDGLDEAMRNPLDRERPTFEEVLTTRLARIGPVVALGRPGDVLPPIGAARTYVANDEWKDRVASWVNEAALIVMLVDATDAMRWELAQVASCLQKVWLVLPPAPVGQQGRDPEWKASWERLRSERSFLPEVGDDAAIIRFERTDGGHAPVVLRGLSASAWDVLDVVLHALTAPEDPGSSKLAIARRHRDRLCREAASFAKILAAFFGLATVVFGAVVLFATDAEAALGPIALSAGGALLAALSLAWARAVERGSLIATEAAMGLVILVAAAGVAVAVRVHTAALVLVPICAIPFLRLLQLRRAALRCIAFERDAKE